MIKYIYIDILYITDITDEDHRGMLLDFRGRLWNTFTKI